MDHDESETARLSRRALLGSLGVAGTTAVAGCSFGGDESSETPTATTSDGTATPDKTTPTVEDPTSTPEEKQTTTPTDQAPTLATATTPQDNGQVLRYQIVAEDDQELAYAAVVYGDRKQEWEGEQLGKRVDESGKFTDLGQPEECQVVFIAEDSAGQETRKNTYPDETAPDFSNIELSSTENAGEIHAILQGEDGVGLEELQLLLDGQPAHQENVSGQSETSLDTTIDASDLATVGENNDLTALLEDWNGNTVESDSDTYVRKFDKMDEEDTRLSFGAVYQPWFGNEDLLYTEERMPTTGSRSNPISKEVYERNMDQMQGHGINRIMLSYNGDPRLAENAERFLDTELIDEMDVEPFYTFARWFWGEDYPDSADNYREEIVEPHMTWIRDNILSRENATTFNDRPVMQTWNTGYIPWNNYTHEKILDEYGSYEALVDDIKDNLRVEEGEEPFLVGGADGRGEYGYGERAEDLFSQFDAVTTWTAGGLWSFSTDEDGEVTWHNTETTHDQVLNYVEENFQGHREFTDNHGMEFVPMVFPGFNEMKDPQRRHPRSPEFFEQMLELADEYRTTEMVNSSVYNNWEEATHLEPGVFEPGPFGVENYGTAYLEKVKEFQQEGS